MSKKMLQVAGNVGESLVFHFPVFMLGVLLTIWFTLPAAAHLHSYFIGDGGDNYQYAGFQYLVATNIDAGKWPYAVIQSWYYPQGFEFARGYDSVLSTLGGGLLVLLTRDLAYSYNLSIFASFLFNFLAAYALYWTVARSRLWASVGATLFGFSFYALARAGGHANLLLIGGFPLFFLALLKLVRRQGWTEVALLGVSSVLLVLSSLQYGVMAFAALVVVVPLCFLLYPGAMSLLAFRKLPAAWGKLLVVGVLSLVVLLPFVWPFLRAYQAGDFYARGTHDFSPRLVDLVFPNPYLPVPLGKLLPMVPGTVGIEQAIALGPVFFILVALIFWRFRRNPVVALSALVLTVFGIVALGTRNPETGIVLPYQLLSSVFPFSAIPEAGRFVIIVNLVGALLIASYGRRLFKGRTAQVTAGVIVLGMLVLERSSWGKFFQQPVPSLELAQAVQVQPGNAVLELPLFEQRQSVSPVYFHKATLTGEPHWLAHTPEAMSFLQGNPVLAGLTCFDRTHLTGTVPGQNVELSATQRDEFFRYLKDSGVRTVVIRTDGTLFWDMCKEALARVDQLFPQFVTAQAFSEGKQAEHTIKWQGNGFTGGLFFPQAGEVRLLGFSYIPYLGEPPEVSIDGIRLPTETWSVEPQPHESGDTVVFAKSATSADRYSVNEGSRLSVYIPGQPSRQGVLTMWYEYQPNGGVTVELTDGQVTKVYEEPTVQVWRVE